MDEKLLTLRELRIALVGPGCPFTTPPARDTILSWRNQEIDPLPYHVLPGGNRKHYKLSEVLGWLKVNTREVR